MLRRLAASTAAAALLVTGWSVPARADALPAVPPQPPALKDIAGYPQQNPLPVWPDNPADASIPIGVIPYDEIAPKLNALQQASKRVSARVAGKSAGGHDLYVVTVTAPETRAEAQRQERWKRLIEDEPVRARTDKALLRDYKTPLFVNANIHDNE